MRQGGEYFTDPQGPARRRYEALRAYFAEEMPAAEVADRFGYSTASVMPVSAQTVWKILEDEGLPRLARRDNTRRGTPHRLEAVKAAALDSWPAGTAIRCDHAGLLLLFPAMVTLRLPELIGACGYPSTSQLSSWQSLAALLLAKCGRISRIHHISAFTDDVGLGLALGLTALPKATHLTSYSYRVRRDSNL